MDVRVFLIGIVTSFVGTLGFSLVVRLRPKYLAFAAFGGVIAYVAWFLCDFWGLGDFVSSFVGAALGALYSEILARVFKTPTIEFSLPCVIPLAPGRNLYYAMAGFLGSSYSGALDNMITTLMIAFGIAAGMIFVSIIPTLCNKNRRNMRRIRTGNSK